MAEGGEPKVVQADFASLAANASEQSGESEKFDFDTQAASFRNAGEDDQSDTEEEEREESMEKESDNITDHNLNRYTDHMLDKQLSSALKISFRADLGDLSLQLEHLKDKLDEEIMKSSAREAVNRGMKTEFETFRAAVAAVQIERVNISAISASVEEFKKRLLDWEKLAKAIAIQAIEEVNKQYKATLDSANKDGWELRQEVIYLNERLDWLEHRANLPSMGRGSLAGRGRMRAGKAVRPGRAETETLVRARLAAAPSSAMYGFATDPPDLRDQITRSAEARQARDQFEAATGKSGIGNTLELKRSLEQTRLEREVTEQQLNEKAALEGISVLSLGADDAKQVKKRKLVDIKDPYAHVDNPDHDHHSRAGPEGFRQPGEPGERGRPSGIVRTSTRSRSQSSSILSSISSTSAARPIDPTPTRAAVAQTQTPARSAQMETNPTQTEESREGWVSVESGKCFGKID